MNILYFDIDTLRPDHLGCYGYHRNTSPNIDRLAAEGTVFTNYYCSDAPCLPSRAALFLGQPGIHNGVVNHGGLAADPYLEGAPRNFRQNRNGWIPQIAQAGLYPVSVSPFAERHSSWWFYQGWREMYNTGKGGGERMDEVMPVALDWLDRNRDRENWFLHVNIWDPHTPYRVPDEYGNPFEDAPLPDWIDEETIQKDFESFGPHSAQECHGFRPGKDTYRHPSRIANLADFRKWLDGYDVGIKYADDAFGQIMAKLEELGMLEDTAIIISSDHGENQGELNVYGDHQTADYVTNRVPLIIRWPGKTGGKVDTELHYNFDLPPTVLSLLGGDDHIQDHWDGLSFANALDGDEATGRDFIVVGNCAWACQRAVRWDDYILIRTFHTGAKNFPEFMLFDLATDPHEQHNLAQERPELVYKGLAMLETWTAQMMATSTQTVDPLWTVMSEGGPLHTRSSWQSYAEYLRETGRARHADTLESQSGGYVVGTEPLPGL